MAVYTSEAHNLIKAMGKAGITFPATKAELLEKFNAGLKNIKANGKYDEILAKYGY